MRKRVKRLNLNQSSRSHDKALIKNLFTSLVMYGKVTTTKPRAQALRAYACNKVFAFKRLGTSLESKRWIKAEVSTYKYSKRVTEKLKGFDEKFAVTTAMTKPRGGDNAPQYEVSIINYDATKTNEQ
ncbi:hypothetical protein CO112_01690 [Candidatus Dojkabacteria bacterium CG_4_9_14_3_um_filter_150_Dojkabacteria_WS6_41_13]|uniref:50S ribosomal protein L17 n=1 Tax=Candidatus Dojkabacteria bacterium CG_4_10_14_0_2_um_filter_Dojkabacteria_WS6_41_15 TaxID=2014249 RepID=A0A2M7W0Y1_9BACT|nr:MAG: hypothetical protein COX64_04495 [Candidatus Dojkabacteria bacterium CG_4_10_14_0_2_um_filter_Dojkabacteria_WS6_41_15]PJB22974.1 MAG: hypothetical protein CO112_01690 [Candidatus Dojkabacteria bacterium CG_4_9_14_3_um_filter_150_Dojkabacteria_WS6_41_13]